MAARFKYLGQAQLEKPKRRSMDFLSLPVREAEPVELTQRGRSKRKAKEDKRSPCWPLFCEDSSEALGRGQACKDRTI